MNNNIEHFQWTDELVKEYARSFGYAGEPCIEEFKKEHTFIQWDWQEEIEKCMKSPYYLAINYLRVNDEPFTTFLNEKQFNSYFGIK